MKLSTSLIVTSTHGINADFVLSMRSTHTQK
ncbi:rCG36269 [Rattus norvegicus]|uniref:RCG36269 n=1 Tax=Rattus norvegicus TaxID=10116 RepID=A6IPY4_RAT|nr:rCG36269 [Rattus norvegicus]